MVSPGQTTAIEILFANGQSTTLDEIPLDSVVFDVVAKITNDLELDISKELISNWGLTVYTERSCTNWINLHWLEPTQKISELQQPIKLLFGRQAFTSKDLQQPTFSSPLIRQILYHQLLQSYVRGLGFCPAFKAAKLSALAAYAEVTSSEYLISGTEWLKQFVPPRLRNVPHMSRAVSKLMSAVGNRSEEIVQTAFIKGMISLDSFCNCYYDMQMESCDGVVGLTNQQLLWMDKYTLEPIIQWKLTDIESLSIISEEQQLCLAFKTEKVFLKSPNVQHLTNYISASTGLVATIHSPKIYTINTDKEESLSVEDDESLGYENVKKSPIDSKCTSPISSRNNGRRKAFRQKNRAQTTLDIDRDPDYSPDEFNLLIETASETKWTNRDSNPVYDSIASSRVDATLRRTNITYSSVSKATAATSTLVNDSWQLIASNVLPQPSYNQPLGVYPLEVTHPLNATSTRTDFETKSKQLSPGEILKDYATLKREFRMFYVKLPNGKGHWELASIYQPINKLIARLCVIIHIEKSEDYQLTVEGVLTGTYDNKKQPSFSAVRESIYCLPHIDENESNYMELDSTKSFFDHGIYSSRVLKLSSIDPNQKDPIHDSPVRLPQWVKFRQCWLSVVHGMHPCSVQESIAFAAILYQCYVLDRTEVNSVISFCNATDFLPSKYARVKGIENKILMKRESLLSYTRMELEQLYIEGVCASPTYDYVFFPCKEPRRQFLSNSKMHQILIGIGKDGIVRMNYKTKEILDTWDYNVLKNWGFTENSFVLAFENSTYPVKCSQGEWMSLLATFHVESLLEEKSKMSLASPSAVYTQQKASHSYFLLETKNDNVQQTKVTKESNYFTLEKVYDDLIQKQKGSQRSQNHNELDSSLRHYVNPIPNSSLINPNARMVERFKHFGILNQNDNIYDQVAFDDDDSNVLYDQVAHTSTDDELEMLLSDDNDMTSDEDLISTGHYKVPRKVPKSISPEHIYDMPPDT